MKQNVLNKIYTNIPIVYLFENTDNKLDCIKFLYADDISNINDSKLLLLDDEYILILYVSLSLAKKQTMPLKELGYYYYEGKFLSILQFKL